MRSYMYMFVFAVLTATPAAALDDGRLRILLAARQASLVESMSTLACYTMAELNVSHNRNAALEHVDTYNTVLTAFLEGHEWMGLNPAPDDDPLHIAYIEDAHSHWASYQPAIRQIIAGDLQSVVMHQILRDTETVVSSALTLTENFISDFGNEVMSPSHFSGLRMTAYQRMLTQRALRMMCLIRYDLAGETTHAHLIEIIDEIDLTMERLLNGDNSVRPPPNSRVARNLQTAALFWKKIRPTIEAQAQNMHPTDSDVQKMLRLNETVVKQFNQAIDGFITKP